eukprot:CAMPEP_0202890812 /NCGR_PEP_ID=MMETSP1392-20130828/1103_1 /ASSEMBLY_ACC=CAM_ASM_000868 /TAXON_ID=225041 /ORGANISM="Chlamydomonas chlamydogama, Strain SAG 11-48b" /LENGTH=422 /DNA_ID=CAMNT_0049574455 /DNA_START=106 /DNA_END=1370 /DNA_ORIENTATION=-
MSNAYGGDEVNAIVVDIGTCLTKAGYAGDDIPKAIYPSQVGVVAGSDSNGMEVDGQAAGQPKRQLYVGQSAVNYRRDNMEVVSPFSPDDILSDWELVEGLWEHAFKDRLHIQPAEYAMMIAEPSHNTKEAREKTTELMFEKFGVPALFLAKNAVLSSFASARQTALVVDAGYKAVTATAVQDGYLLNKSVVRSSCGGCTMTTCMQKGLEARGYNIRPRYAFKRTEHSPGDFTVEELSLPATTPSFRAFQVEGICADVKESICRSSDNAFNETENANIPTVAYELPDGTEIHVGPDRFKVPELLFQPQLISTYPGMEPPRAPAYAMHSLVLDSIQRCDVDVRKELYGSVVLTGGIAQLSGLRDRLERELLDNPPQGAKIKVFMPINTLERRFSTWLGGSILASLGSFQQMWMSKKEYDEAGAA